MNCITRGLLLGLVQVLIVSGLGGKLLYDRSRLPRVWVKTAAVDPDLPIRGRYVRLGVVVEAKGFREESFDPPPAAPETEGARPVRTRRNSFPDAAGKFVLEGDRLVVYPDPSELKWWFQLSQDEHGKWAQSRQALAFFIPEKADDPSVRPEGEELWVEVTLTESGNLRPVRLGIKKAETLTPLEF